MRTVRRLSEPNSLKSKKKGWKQDLLKCLKDPKCAKTQKEENLRKKYSQTDVRKKLSTMYKGYCCYCESVVNTITTEHIEHRKPQSKFPGDTFEWTNLHLACPDCNRKKSDKYNYKYPILDSCSDDLDDHLSYILFYRKARSFRGKTTIDHADLNRDELLTQRTIVYHRVQQAIESLQDNPNDPANGLTIELIKKEYAGQFGSLVRTVLTRALTQVEG